MLAAIVPMVASPNGTAARVEDTRAVELPFAEMMASRLRSVRDAVVAAAIEAAKGQPSPQQPNVIPPAPGVNFTVNRGMVLAFVGGAGVAAGIAYAISKRG